MFIDIKKETQNAWIPLKYGRFCVKYLLFSVFCC